MKRNNIDYSIELVNSNQKSTKHRYTTEKDGIIICVFVLSRTYIYDIDR